VTGIPAAYRAAILSARPDLADAPMTAHTQGWDSLGIEAGDYLFKFPKTPVAEERLRREAKYLALIRPRVPLRVPNLKIHDVPLAFSEHRMIPGRIIETQHYDKLTDAQRDQMAAELGRFYAALHAIPTSEATAAGALPIPDWPAPDVIVRVATPVLPAALHAWMHRVLAAWNERPPDDTVTGYFDGHGWNMAFDHEHGVLNGVYDFADGGLGARHQDFSYGHLTSPDLAERTIVHYEALTSLVIDRRQVALHAAVRGLSEADDLGPDPQWYVDAMVRWHDAMQDNPALRV
jgi:aminoglycoside phosphotransferase (APT) family kinase protein